MPRPGAGSASEGCAAGGRGGAGQGGWVGCRVGLLDGRRTGHVKQFCPQASTAGQCGCFTTRVPKPYAHSASAGPLFSPDLQAPLVQRPHHGLIPLPLLHQRPRLPQRVARLALGREGPISRHGASASVRGAAAHDHCLQLRKLAISVAPLPLHARSAESQIRARMQSQTPHSTQHGHRQRACALPEPLVRHTYAGSIKWTTG